MLTPGHPFADQRRFAEAGGGGNQGQFPVYSLFQALNQARAKNHFRLGRGDIKFSGQNWRRHGSIVQHMEFPPPYEVILENIAEKEGLGLHHFCL